MLRVHQRPALNALGGVAANFWRTRLGMGKDLCISSYVEDRGELEVESERVAIGMCPLYDGKKFKAEWPKTIKVGP